MALKIVLDYLNGTVCGFDDSFVTDTAYTKEEIDKLLTRVLDLKGILDTFDELPETDNKVGDVYIVREDQSEYVWLPSNVWEKLGPIKELFYEASKVKFSRNFQLSGTYTNVGNVKIGDGTLDIKNKSLEDLVEQVFDMTVQPTLGTAPSNTITLTGSGSYEVGTKFTPKYSVTFNQGKYNCPWNNTTVDDGTSDTAWTVTDTDSIERTSKTGEFPEFTVQDGTNYKLTAVTSYSAGNVAQTNKGEDSDPIVQRGAGDTAAANSGAVTAFRYAYIGSVAEDVEVDESVIKSLTRFKTGSVTKTVKTGASGNNEIPLVNGAVKIIVAVPTGASKTSCGGYDLNQVLLVSASNTPITSDYHLQSSTVEVSGAVDGECKKAYKVYIYQPAVIDPGEVHSIKIA